MSDIQNKYLELGGANSFLGNPLHEERMCPDGVGKYVTYQNSSNGMISSIHFHPDHGCYETHGAIRAKWESLGFEQGILGYPISDEKQSEENIGVNWTDAGLGYVKEDALVSEFQYGKIKYFYGKEKSIKVYDKSNVEIGQGLFEKLGDSIRKIF